MKNLARLLILTMLLPLPFEAAGKEDQERPVLKGGFGRVWGTVIGVLILSLIGNILNLTDFVSPYLNGAIQGIIIILAVILQRERKTAL